MRVYIDDDGLHLFFEFAQGNFAKSHALLQNQAEQLFKSLRGGGLFSISLKVCLQCLLRNHILAGTLQQQMAGFTDALRRHTERRAVLKEGVNGNLHLQLIGILCCDRGGLTVLPERHGRVGQ